MKMVKDLDGHNYRLPAEFANEFNELLEKISKSKLRSDEWYDLNIQLDMQYGHFMVG